jgi:hypothetical protein
MAMELTTRNIGIRDRRRTAAGEGDGDDAEDPQ